LKRHCSVSSKLAEFIFNISIKDIPERIINYAKERTLDIIGACVAGSHSWNYNLKIIKGLTQINVGNSSIIGRTERLSCPSAAMVNSAYGHALELDDGHKNAGVHAGTVIVPTALAVGELLHSKGEDILVSIILGYDIIYRVARTMNPMLIKKGFYPSSVCGTLGAATTATKLLSLNAKEISNALGLAGLQTAGIREASLSAQSSKSVMVGHASFTGIISAWLAQGKLVGPNSIFEGKYGLLNIMSNKVNYENIIHNLGERFEVSDTYVKLYPTCRHIHPIIEGIIHLKEKYGFTLSDVERVIIGTHEIALDVIGKIYRPENMEQAQFSLPYITAIVLKFGSIGIQHLKKDYLLDQDLLKIARLVEVKLDNKVNNMFPGKRGASIELILKSGEKLKEVVYILKGSPELPVDWNTIYKKYINCTTGVFLEKEANRLADQIHNLEKIEDITKVMSLLVREDKTDNELSGISE
jgi:2-methylcitrate dehydratase PrpD